MGKEGKSGRSFLQSNQGGAKKDEVSAGESRSARPALLGLGGRFGFGEGGILEPVTFAGNSDDSGVV